MRPALLALLFVATLGLCPAVAAGPSFDCANATSLFENLVCGNATLSKLDGRLADVYRNALASEPYPERLKGEQQVWLHSTSHIYVKPGTELSATQAIKATEQLIDSYQRRLVELEAIQRPSLVDCAQPKTKVDQIVCPNPTLREMYEEFLHRASILAAQQQDSVRRVQLREADNEWRRWIINDIGGLPVTDKNRSALESHIRTAIDFRSTVLDALEHPSPVDPLPVDVPPNWWGVDLFEATGRSDVEASSAFVRSDRTLVIETSPSFSSKTRTDDQWIFLDVFNRRLVANGRDNRELIRTGGEALKEVYRRFGLSHVNIPIGDFSITPRLRLLAGSDNCPRPVRHYISYELDEDSYFPGIFAIARLPHPQRFEYNRPRCISGYGDSWTADFHDQYCRFVGTLSDGTFITFVGDRYVVRFRPDLTSPFFAGRSDVVIVPEDALYRLSDEDGGPSGQVALRAVKAVVDEAAKAQMEAAQHP